MSDTSNQNNEDKKLLEMRADEAPKKGLSDKAKKEIREWIVSLAVALIAVVLIRSFLFTVIRVEGHSMDDTLHDGDRMIVTIVDMKLNGVNRGDVVICHYPGRSENFVKRVIGLGGDVIEVRDGITYRNEVALSEPFVEYPAVRAFAPYEVPEGKIFVMGDNRANSHDSRADDVGPLDEGQLVGIARVIMWPFSDIGVIESGEKNS